MPRDAAPGILRFNAASVANGIIGTWRYPADTNRYWWNLESTTNFVTWRVVQTNVGPDDPRVGTTNKFEFFRLHAH